MTDYSVIRDQWGRPFVSQDGGPLKFEGKRKTPTNAVGYQRVSTLAGVLDDKSMLGEWQAAQTAIGVVRERSVYAQLASLVSKHKDPWRESKTQLKQLVARAQQAASSDDGSGLGTAFHDLTEVDDKGQEPDFMLEMFRPWLAAYREVMAAWEVLDAEPFLVVDELQVAGSMDKLLRHRESGAIVAADLKTGASDPFYPLKVEIQVACYAHGQKYDQATGVRTPLHPDIDLKRGLLIHVPVRGGVPSAKLYPLDLERGWRAAQVARQVASEFRKVKALEAIG
ncbi:hypothetical protein [Antrihabitans cavernicola]|uniref:PD-(D/E)XK endonuclease-like domain-containing protein n=1 Tax=Antrihabitans cavernicola TaxID=2495913 RepID=A0A5A7S6Q3_9NOCA|nr:hypothetical protein [Spelaeibacter cavernicola]KAA0021828.1 hypothetical protein FOY51_15640 [Spelaeibacter cavernicola]